MERLRAVAIFVYVQSGCKACAAAKPHLESFRRNHPEIIVTELDVSRYPWEIGGREPRATPQYLFKIDNEFVHEHKGALTTKQLDKIVGELKK
jgi:hypothetical protein